MIQKIKSFLYLYILIFIFSCSSEKDCAKTIIIQNEFIISGANGTTIIPEITQVVDCSFPEPDAPEIIEDLPKLSNFSYDVLEFNFTSDTGNNTNRLQYKIQLNNLSDKTVKGIPYITKDIDGLISTEINFGNCKELAANSSCIISFDKESSLDLGLIKEISIEKVEYFITK